MDVKCERCNGTGQVRQTVRSVLDDDNDDVLDICGRCGGGGLVGTEDFDVDDDGPRPLA